FLFCFSGVATLSCTDCSGSSTASSDITDPGSPFSTASNNSEDSALQTSSITTTKMPPTQTVHSTWPWSVGEAPPVKRALIGKTEFPKRIKIDDVAHQPLSIEQKVIDTGKTVYPVVVNKGRPALKAAITSPAIPAIANSLPKDSKLVNHNHKSQSVSSSITKVQQGKITEYFKYQTKTNVLRRKQLPVKPIEGAAKNAKKKSSRNALSESAVGSSPTKKQSGTTLPRKILPAPSKLQCDKIAVNNVNSFAPTVTLTTLTIQPSLTYIHTKTPKPPDNFFLPQFAAINNDKLNTIPLMSATPCINTVIPPLQKIATVNSFNCFKLNATVVPIVKLNTLPSKLNGSNIAYVDTGVPTVPVPSKTPSVSDCMPAATPHIAPITHDHPGIFNPDGLLNMYHINAHQMPQLQTSHCIPPASEQHQINPFEFQQQQQQSNKTDECSQTQFDDEPNFLVADQAEDIYNIDKNRLEKVQNSSNNKSPEGTADIQLLQSCLTATTTNAQNKCKTIETSSSLRINITSCSNNNNNISNINSSVISNVHHHHQGSLSLSGTRPIITEHCQPDRRHEDKKNDEDDEEELECRSSSRAEKDSDSGVSCKGLLEVSVSEVVVVKSQKSPILSQPKTIRFPARQQESTSEAKEIRSVSAADTSSCRWLGCDTLFETSGALLEHLQVRHVISQATQETYVCLWNGCKVHGRTSCSRSWLERHVLAHAGTKPFRCIVEGCGMRFNSQISLERHVNNHFNSDGSQNGTAKKSVENGSAKLFKRNGKKIRFRRQPWSARMFDFFDSGIMEGLQDRLLRMTEKRTMGQIEGVSGDVMMLRGQVLATRVQKNGQKQLLVKWHPADITPDEWVNENEYSSSKTVSIRSLEPSSVDNLKPILFPSLRNSQQEEQQQPKRLKHQRKPKKNT
ncbi:uncharacterized protein LOC108740161, partial [Agrilus planipennis]|uniref:Uncharacterized protein LOC108740161 n=1 Tax=Agrilus planipennis TaxID=224129 RepID=A0A1W4XAM6_AGRPL